METRKLGTTDLEITRIGLGTWALGGGGYQFGWGPQDEEDSIATIRKALDLGINWIDTAPAYGMGQSELAVGRAIQGRRHEVILATKCGLAWDEDGRIFGRLKAESVRSEIDESLRRLGVDVIDLYQIHWPDPETDIEEAWTAIADGIRAGKIRYAGVSNFTVKQMEFLQRIHPIASLQPPYSMISRQAEEELLAYCAEHQIGVIAYSPMQVGILTDKFTRRWIASLASDDWRRDYSNLREPALSANLKLVEKLRSIAAREGHTTAQLAIAWVLRRPEITGAIAGARHPEQIEETTPAADWHLPPEILEQVAKLLEEREQALAQAVPHRGSAR